MPRILDATGTQCLLTARAPIEAATLEALDELYPLPYVQNAVPFLPPDAYGATITTRLVAHADVIEPINDAAHEAARLLPLRPGQILVDPTGVTLGDEWHHRQVPPGVVRERIAWIEAPLDPRDLDDVLARLPADQRLRLADPHAHLQGEHIDRLVRHHDPQRITLALENANGMALATARHALRAKDGPLIRSALLGLGPRTGLPPTELLVAPEQAPDLRPYAERAGLVAARPIPPGHPLWGADRDEVVEAERFHRGGPVRWNAATLPVLLDARLEELDLHLDAATRRHLARLLAARLRPGEAVDGPTLYAFLATHVDLTAHAQERDER